MAPGGTASKRARRCALHPASRKPESRCPPVNDGVILIANHQVMISRRQDFGCRDRSPADTDPTGLNDAAEFSRGAGTITLVVAYDLPTTVGLRRPTSRFRISARKNTGGAFVAPTLLQMQIVGEHVVPEHETVALSLRIMNGGGVCPNAPSTGARPRAGADPAPASPAPARSVTAGIPGSAAGYVILYRQMATMSLSASG